LENVKYGDHLEYLDVDGRIILEWIFGCRPVVGLCEHGDEPAASIKGREFLV
jgi:hypothetical protein